jgi:hypothetical protein
LRLHAARPCTSTVAASEREMLYLEKEDSGLHPGRP